MDLQKLKLGRSAAIENKSAHGEPVKPLERLEQTFLAAVRDVPSVTRQEVTVRALHRFFLEAPFHGQKGGTNPLRQRLERFEQSEAIERLERLSLRPNDAFYSILAC